MTLDQAEREGGAGPEPGPLHGIRVLEMGSFIAGPFAGRLYADYGAEVIKVEPPEGDPMRQWGAAYKGHYLWWPVISRNKKSVTLDLRQEEGRALAFKLAAQCDILIENFRPGTLEQWGLGYDRLQAVNPGLILVRVSGYGQDGPYAARPGFGAVAEAMGGLRYINGFPDRPPPRAGISLGDGLAAMFAVMGSLSALVNRSANGGRGQVIDAAIYEAVLALTETIVPEDDLLGVIRERWGTIIPGVAPSNIYPTRDGSWIVIGANAESIFRRLCAIMGQPELATDPRFDNHRSRAQHQQELDTIVAQWTRHYDVNALEENLAAAGVPAGRVYSAADLVADPHMASRQALTTVEHPEMGPVRMPNVFPRFSRSKPTIRTGGPSLGEHNREVFTSLLGLDEAQLQALREKGVTTG